MNNNKKRLAVFIGRFQPFHSGHVAAVNTALNNAERVLMLVGSSNSPRTPKNPWTYEERFEMIRSHFPDATGYKEKEGRIVVKPLYDYRYNESRWLQEVQDNVRDMGVGDDAVLICGHHKDESSYYLNSFKWKQLDCGFFPLGSDKTIDGTKIRELFFEGHPMFLHGVVSDHVLNIMSKTVVSLDGSQLLNEYDFIKNYKAQWANAPYPPTFTTADAVVMQSGHVLLVRRKTEPGKGLWALPGGFVNQKEPIFDSCIRELREETGLKVPEVILRKAKAEYQYFDDPDRSLRGRTITHAFFFKLDDSQDLPRVKGGDDAEKAKWISLSSIESMSKDMFEDHWHIIEYFKNRAAK